VGVEGNNPYVAVALSIIALVVTWFLLVGMAVVGSGRRKRAGGTGTGLGAPVAEVEVPSPSAAIEATA
jgi:hypothetical protein